jgi:hypothetical protein
MSWNQRLTNLNDILADLYPTIDDSRRIVRQTRLQPAFIAFNNAAILNWFHILEQADRHGQVDALIRAARKDYPDNEWLAAIERQEPASVRGPDIQKDIPWHAEDGQNSLEKIIGDQSTLLPINFLRRGVVASRSVGRILRSDGASGTGFLISPGLVITNHHVLKNTTQTREATIEFNYEHTMDGANAPIRRYRLSPELGFATSEANDWTASGVEEGATTDWGTLAPSEIPAKVGDFVNIIQHPGGGPKHVGMYHNTVVFVGSNRIQYLTDTLPGSSGSPVFNSRWEVVALHHSGGWLREPGSKETFYRNEGIDIHAVLEGLAAAGMGPCSP